MVNSIDRKECNIRIIDKIHPTLNIINGIVKMHVPITCVISNSEFLVIDFCVFVIINFIYI